ncbi:Thioesterase superfamily [uncultured Desulfobacterium sp.]|uniref:Thioesterase superfamily n=1 Tax=uncultured Desulfobacterium sp. TaxID=201089 RepID=A0A445N2F3_9BACT|nr:Thioesterase superfamily [uncultured Desulfobacterium sp.]
MRNRGDKEEYRFLPTRSWDQHCFGCGPTNRFGLQMKFYTDEKSVFSWIEVPEHLCGWNRLVHGGVISTILDEVMGWSAIHLYKIIVLTKNMSIDFVRPVFVNEELKAEGRVTKFDNPGEVTICGTIHNGRGELCAKATGKFSYFPPATIQEMGIMDDDFVRDFEEYIKEN